MIIPRDLFSLPGLLDLNSNILILQIVKSTRNKVDVLMSNQQLENILDIPKILIIFIIVIFILWLTYNLFINECMKNDLITTLKEEKYRSDLFRQQMENLKSVNLNLRAELKSLKSEIMTRPEATEE